MICSSLNLDAFIVRPLPVVWTLLKSRRDHGARVKRQQGHIADGEENNGWRMNMYNRINVWTRAVDFSVNEYLVRDIQPAAVGRYRCSVERDLDHLFFSRLARAEFAGSAGANEDAIGPWEACTHMAGRGIGKFEMPKDPTGLRFVLLEFVELSHEAPCA
jgi:hypothetical protein